MPNFCVPPETEETQIFTRKLAYNALKVSVYSYQKHSKKPAEAGLNLIGWVQT